MKKSLSVFLAILMLALTAVPAFAEGEAGQVTVTFQGPTASAFPADAYTFVQAVDPANPLSAYEQDDPGKYLYYNGVLTAFADIPAADREAAIAGSAFYNADGTEDNVSGEYIRMNDTRVELFSNIVFEEDRLEYLYAVLEDQTDTHFWKPKKLESGSFENGSVIEFDVRTSEAYDVSTATVYVNDELISKNQNGVYAVIADRDLTIRVKDCDPATGEKFLLRNHFVMTLTSGEGYSVKPLKNETSKAVFYGDDYTFRVKITKGFTGSGMKVIAQRGRSDLSELLGEEADFISVIGAGNEALDGIVNAEVLSSVGVDEDGFRMYKVKNVTSDCRIIVSGVQKESQSGIMSFLRRILKFLLDLLGLGDKLPSLTTTYDVTYETSDLPAEVTAELSYGKNTYTDNKKFAVMQGDSVTVKLTSTVAPDLAMVTWTGKDANYANPVWTSHYNRYTGITTYTAEYYIDNITADITITAA